MWNELWRGAELDATFESTTAGFRDDFLSDAGANNVVLHCRTWYQHDARPSGDSAAALASIEIPRCDMPEATDLYSPVCAAELEARSIPSAARLPISSL